MSKNFKLIIEYDGTLYHGWQRQKGDRTIQGEIEKTLFKMTGKTIVLIGSGRTDAGVHAFGQVANFHCHTELQPEIFQKGLNSLLPDDIVIKECSQTDEAFHARYDAKNKTYNYKILNHITPAAICRQYAWHISKTLDIGTMRSAFSYAIGTHDFKAFEGAGSPRSHSIRCIMQANIIQKGQGYLINEVQANGFLRYMVRNIVGTLVDVGLNKITPLNFKQILLSKNRKQASATAPAHGLFLLQVDY